ncbi:CBS domain-containing protein [Treponema zuelzerae]|uniref:CBS domain-containing protein n=1 Tax=Teretinema zuelzerae TaxID=156 RepID=A0AAE3ELB3_9SPIR|nr:CBS domain-containing protein [Teretinema zuelzerae]MCD1655803.1 CBS domain-containing protein [Teretinema zuelzerae]
MLAIPIHQDNSPEAVLEILFQLKVRDVMTHHILTGKPSESLRDIREVMRKNRITGIPIADQGTLLGIVSMDDIITALDEGWMDDPASLHMTTKVIVLQDTMSLSFCVSYFNKYSFGRFPVLDKDSKLVGIVTASDVISTLLVALNKEIGRIQSEDAASIAEGKMNAAEPDSGCRIVEFKTEPFNFEIAGRASTEVKKILKGLGIDPAITRRIGIASYELEINQVVHSEGGTMKYSITPDRLVIEAVDIGPGIPDLSKAMTEGFSTATERVRSLGFGAGMGLPNTKRVSDDFTIESEAGTGTRVQAIFNLKGSATP